MTTRTRTDAGFSLPEVLISMGIMLVVLAGTFSAMTQAMKAEESAKLITDMNSTCGRRWTSSFATSLQVGQGLPDGRRIGVPNGAGGAADHAGPGRRPRRRRAWACRPTSPSHAVAPGGHRRSRPRARRQRRLHRRGHHARRRRHLRQRAAAVDCGQRLEHHRPAGRQPQIVNGGIDIDDGGGDDIRVGDLIMLTAGRPEHADVRDRGERADAADHLRGRRSASAQPVRPVDTTR